MFVIGNKVREEKRPEATAATKNDRSRNAELVEKAANGDFGAFGELYSIFLDQIYRYVFYQVRDRMTAEDITEEVFVKAWKAIGSCKGREGTFSAWLYRIAHNHLINTLRRSSKTTSLDKDEPIEIADPKNEIETKIECEELLETITHLPENQRQIIILKFIEGLDNREISKITGKNEGAIRITQMRALATIRNKLGQEEQGNGK